MDNVNERIADLKYKLKERDRQKNLVKRLEDTQSELKYSKENLYNQLKKEELDVEKLEGLSIAAIIHAIKGDKDEELDKERSEAFSAKLKYDAVCSELEKTTRDMDELRRSLWGFNNIDRDYDELIAEKEKSLGQEAALKIHDVLDRQADIKIKHKEVNEAVSAGRNLLDALNNVRESLNSAEGWGKWDMFGGGFLSTSMKHSHLDDAKYEIDEVQSLLRRFHRELGDIGEYVDINVDIGSFLTFADYFFDGFLVDWQVQSRIEEAQCKVGDTIQRVESLLYKLENETKSLDSKLYGLENERKGIVENA